MIDLIVAMGCSHSSYGRISLSNFLAIGHRRCRWNHCSDGFQQAEAVKSPKPDCRCHRRRYRVPHLGSVRLGRSASGVRSRVQYVGRSILGSIICRMFKNLAPETKHGLAAVREVRPFFGGPMRGYAQRRFQIVWRYHRQVVIHLDVPVRMSVTGEG